MLDDLDDLIHAAMAEWKVPGLALAVMQGDDVLQLTGYGVRSIEADAPITPDTQFCFA